MRVLERGFGAEKALTFQASNSFVVIRVIGREVEVGKWKWGREMGNGQGKSGREGKSSAGRKLQ